MYQQEMEIASEESIILREQNLGPAFWKAALQV